jgi:hypothetical protein
VIICIPSYKRAALLAEKTMRVLPKGLQVDIICSNAEDAVSYISTNYGRPVTVQIPEKPLGSLLEKLNYIPKFYKEGQRVFVVEDDIDSFQMKAENKTTAITPEQLEIVMRSGFAACDEHKCSLWGINPVCNGFYMNPEISTNLKLIVGFAFGMVISHDPFLRLRAKCKHDYERSALHYIKDGAVVRVNYVAAKTTCYTVPGGLQSHPGRLEMEKQSVSYLLKRFPHFLAMNDRRKSLYPELSFRRAPQGIDWKKAQKVHDFMANIK